ncbi:MULTISPECIES: flagellar hook protein FlgE [Pseudomonas]|uniref:Flagellar hook protein FlgE n=1 Tax=Pseudomonas eucalypticola TaxID=2599595 RepID=A0A7D5D5I4_9PSED|nr:MULTISPECIES: flagellar hook protein FlgE [Pseudomonas]QKZ03597.1 flagellar hook protein FlgE [Pseudomonas eucalypticola]
MSFNVGLSGLAAANKALDVTGNNIANVATTGFKSSRTEFADQYAQSIRGTSGKTTVGSGVTTAAVSQQFTQGNIESTGNSLDMAINGNGFFVLSDNGSKLYTRAGAFYSDKSGNIVDSSGNNLQGYTTDSSGNLTSGVLSNLAIDTSNLAPKATSSISETVNLNSSATAPTISPFSADNTSSYNYTFNTDVYDSQGNAHQLNQYFVKDDTSNSWTMYTTIDGVNPTDPTSSTPLSNPLTFNADGSYSYTAGDVTGGLSVNDDGTFSLAGWVPAAEQSDGTYASNGASATADITLDMSNLTQYNATSATTAKDQDGYATGELSALSVSDTGQLTATFTNGKTNIIGQVALANFANVQGLSPAGGTDWRETYASGVPVIGTPNTGTMGSLSASSLEDSNVDLTAELVNLIKAQSNYQANAKTISTESTIMQTTIQMT